MKSSLNIFTIDQALDWLAQGQILLHPTETCYGLAVDATQPQALDRLFALKKREATKPVSLLLSCANHFSEIAKVSSATQKMISQFLPGPLTLVLPLLPSIQKKFDQRIDGGAGWVGLRLTSYASTRALAERYGRPLTTTSANFSSEPEIYDFKTLVENFGYQNLGILGQEDLPKNPPSTVVKVQENHVELLREGSIKFATIQDFLKIKKVVLEI